MAIQTTLYDIFAAVQDAVEETYDNLLADEKDQHVVAVVANMLAQGRIIRPNGRKALISCN